LLSGFYFSTGSSANLIGLILLTVSLRPVATASRFFVFDLIYSDLAAKNLQIKYKLPFSCICKFFDFIPLVINLMNVLLTFIKLSFEAINDFSDLFFDLIEI